MSGPPSDGTKSPSNSSPVKRVRTPRSSSDSPLKKRPTTVVSKEKDGLFSTFASLFRSSNSEIEKRVTVGSGLDAWLPSDSIKIVGIPAGLLVRYERIYPIKEIAVRHVSLTVVQDKMPTVDKNEIYKHLVLTIYPQGYKHKEKQFSLSLYRNKKAEDVIALCERCNECKALFKLFPKENSMEYLTILLNSLLSHRLWTTEHIAVDCQIIDYFNRGNKHFPSSLNVFSRPESLTPLMMAVQKGDESLVTAIIKQGADVTVTDNDGNNILHYAAKTTPEMISLIWNSSNNISKLLNHCNSDGNTPQYVAITKANGRCVATLMGLQKSAHKEKDTKWISPMVAWMKMKSTSAKQFRNYLEKNPESYKECDPVNGNTVLHYAYYKKPLMDFLEAVGDKINVNIRNVRLQTPLHMVVHRNDISLLVVLLGFEVDMNARDIEGNTPLHLAATHLNVETVRTLLCFGSDPTIKNNRGETPRHLAGKHRDNLIGIEVLRALYFFGAKTCEDKTKGCTTACMNRERYMGEAANTESGKQLAEWQMDLDENGNEINQGDTVTSIEEIAQREAVKSIQEATQPKEVKLENMGKEEEGHNVISVMCLDGGGLKGVIQAQILIILQSYLDSPLSSYIDWVGATSAGSYSAVALVQSATFRTLMRRVLRIKDLVFSEGSRPYNTKKLLSIVKEAVGETKMNDIKYPKLALTTYCVDYFPCTFTMTRNYRLPLNEVENLKLGFMDSSDVSLLTACHRTAAAPTYVEPSEGKYMDGGIGSNNPTLDILTDIDRWNTACRVKPKTSSASLELINTPTSSLFAPIPVRVGCVISIGCGIIPPVVVDQSLFEMSDTIGILRGVKNLGMIIVDQVTKAEGEVIDRSRSWCHSLKIPYFRMNAPMFRDVELDCTDDSSIARLIWDTQMWARRNKQLFIDCANVLKQIGPNSERKNRFLVSPPGSSESE